MTTPSADDVRAMATRYAAAWTSGDGQAVAAFYAQDGSITVNDGDAVEGREAIAAMAAEFCADFPDLVIEVDEVRSAGNRAIFFWTLSGTHASAGKPIRMSGWEAWTLTCDPLIARSLEYFDVAEYDRQMAGGV